MRIALLTNFVPPYRLPLFRALAARIDALRILVSTPMEANRSWRAETGDLDVVAQRCLTIPRTWRHPAGFQERSYLHVPLDTMGELSRFRPDVVITAEFGPRTLQAAAWAWARGRVPLIVWATGSERQEEGRGRTRLRQWVLRRTGAVLVNGNSGARYIESLGYPEGCIHRVPYSTDAARFAEASPQRAPEHARDLLHVGTLSERKGVLQLLAALARHAARHPQANFHLTFAGDGPLRTKLEAHPHPANLSVRFAGHVAYGELPALYARAGIVVFSTLADEWGMVVNEAMAAGAPVLGSVHAQAVDELVVDGTTGWRFDPERDESFDAALAKAFAAPEAEIARMRSAARHAALLIDADECARRIVAAAEAALLRQPASAPR